MQSLWIGLLLAPLMAALDDGNALELHYRGKLAPVERDIVGEPVRQFHVFCLVSQDSDKSRKAAFVVEENGNGAGWAWPERFGQISYSDKNHPAGPLRIQLLHEHDGVPHPVALAHPLFEFADKLAAGAKWTDDKTTYEVIGSEKVGERDCWKVAVSTSFGRSQTLRVEKASGLIVAEERKLTMGQGRPYQLQMELESTNSADPKRVASLEPALKTLLSLKKELKRAENETNPQLNDEQLTQASAVLKNLSKQAESTPFAALAADISRDVEAQQRRSGDVSKLGEKFIGQPAATLNLKTHDGKAISPEINAQKVVVLHFWPYHGEPLVEPYGQVGYLEFLHGRRRKLGVNVYGVAVDPRFGETSTQSAAKRDVGKLRDFMNLSYPIALDDGQFLSRFGDPRRVGAKLPLWVVIGPDGKIAHYHVGTYDVKPDEGLRSLDEVVVELVKKNRPAEEPKSK